MMSERVDFMFNDERWLVWQYVLGELDCAASDELEGRLANDLDLQQLLADVVGDQQRLLDCAVSPSELASSDAAQAPGTHSTVRLNETGSRKLALSPVYWAAAAACLVIAVGFYALSLSPERTGEVVEHHDSKPDELAGLVTAWSQTVSPAEASDEIWSGIDASDGAAGWEEMDAADRSSSGEGAASDALEESLSWRVIALSGLAEASGMN